MSIESLLVTSTDWIEGAHEISAYANSQSRQVSLRDLNDMGNSVGANVSIYAKVLKVAPRRNFISKKTGESAWVLNCIIRDEHMTAGLVIWGDDRRAFQPINRNDWISVKGFTLKPKSEFSMNSSSTQEIHVDLSKGRIEHVTPGQNILAMNLPLDRNFVPLKDLRRSIGKTVNILGIIGKVLEPLQSLSKAGTVVLRRNVILYDVHCANFRLTVWGDDVNVIGTLAEFQDAVFFEGVTIETTNGEITGSASKGCLIYVNPPIPAAQQLYAWAKSDQLMKSFSSKISTDPTDSLNKGTCLSLRNATTRGGVVTVYELIVLLTNLEINPDCIFKCCPICWGKCIDGQCPSAGCLGNDPATEMQWSMKIICDFGDHTGQLKRLPLYGRVAEDALGLPSTGPLTLCDRDCETLKRQKLWKRYKLRVQVAPKRSGRNGFKVIECRPFKFD